MLKALHGGTSSISISLGTNGHGEGAATTHTGAGGRPRTPFLISSTDICLFKDRNIIFYVDVLLCQQ